MSYIPKVISDVVDNDLCIGCGLCTYTCPSAALKMSWNDHGFLVAEAAGECCSEGLCLTACPFDPNAKDPALNETGLATLFLKDAPLSDEKLGRYVGVYVGHSLKYRPTSSSGGIASYIFEQLLEQNIVDHIVSVGEAKNSTNHYEYTVRSSKKELFSVSKTKYYPVTLASILPELQRLEGKVAITGVACFVKAIRLAQKTDPFLREKIPFIAGIICGGVKSRFFTEYLASKAGANPMLITSPEYRVKDEQSTASDYSFGCDDTEGTKLIKMRTVGDMWGTGMFKANACDFCDDVTTELADISLGDAWLKPFDKDGRGTSVIVTRSILADRLVNEGIKSGELEAETMPPKMFLESQRGSFNHRHEGLIARISERRHQNIPTPQKRHANTRLLPDALLVQKMRRKVRRKSLITWSTAPCASEFDETMKKTLLTLRCITKLTHYRRALLNKIKRLLK
jgi:coenzyme F420 hydrogenase subunit beta